MRGLTDDILTEANSGQITIWALHAWLTGMADDKRAERLRRTRLGTKKQYELKKEEFFYRHIADSLMTARRTDHAVMIEEVAKFIEERTNGSTSLSSAVRKRFLKGISNEIKRER